MTTTTVAGPAGELLDLADMRRRIRAIFIGSIGNLVEWYDFYAYAAFALYFAGAFFPNSNPVVQQLNAALLFAAGFLVRPLGGWLFGYLADHHGRRGALMLSVSLMCFGSLMIALTPTYASIGIWAPILLAVARIIQGLSLGGEYGTSATYLTEMADQRHRGFYSSFQYVTLIGGQICALLVLLVLQKVFLTNDEIRDWGWRIPFFIGALLALIALVMRRTLHETDAFEAARQVVKRTSSLSALVFGMILQPIYGAISDRIGRKWLLIAFGVCGVLFTIPILTTLQNVKGPLPAFLLIAAAWMIVSGYTSINAVVKAELFPTNIRAIGVGLPYALTVSIFGGTTDSVALGFKSLGHETWFYYYLTGMIGISLVVYLFMRDTKADSAMHRHE